MGRVNTVLGPIAPAELGVTAMHEHMLWAVPGWEYDPGSWFAPERVFAKAHGDLSDFRAAGGRTIVECSGIGLGRDVEYLATLSRSTGVCIVPCTGFWARQGTIGRGILPHFATKDIDEIEDLFVREITVGIGGTLVKAGIIKVGTTNDEPVSPLEERLFRAAARAAKRTGVAVTTHGATAAREQARIFLDERIEPDRVIIGHLDGAYALDAERDQELCRQGFYIGYDHVGTEPSWNPLASALPDAQRVEMVRVMVAAGHAERLILSCDATSWAPWDRTGVNHSNVQAVHLLRSFIPRLGLPDAVVRGLVEENPRRVLSIG